jgi:hypothetical protein
MLSLDGNFIIKSSKNPFLRVFAVFLWIENYPNNTERGSNKGVCSRATKNPVTFEITGFGEPSAIRTPDTLIKSQVLCRLS